MVVKLALIPLSIVALTACGVREQAQARESDMPVSMRIILGIEVSRDSLASVQRKLGASTPWHTGHDGESENHRCYRIGTGDKATTVRFTSDGEMGGPGQVVHDIHVWEGMGPAEDTTKCATLVTTVRVETPGGLRLGMSRREIESVLGRSTRETADTIYYSWSAEQPLSVTDPMYAIWNARRVECFGGRAPFTTVGATIQAVVGARGATSVSISRGDNAIC